MGIKFMLHVLINVIVTMVLIYFIKKVAIKYNVPGLSTVAQDV